MFNFTSQVSQKEKAIDILEEMTKTKSLTEILYFLYDTQMDLNQLKELAEISRKRHTENHS